MTASRAAVGEGVVLRAAEAEVLQFPGGSSMQFLGEAIGTAATMSMHRSALRAGAQGASAHHHRATSEMIYVVTGTLRLLVGTTIMTAGAGDVVMIPPGVPHAFAATEEGDAELIDIVTPGIERFDLFRDIARVANGTEPAGTGLQDQSQYDTYPDESPAWQATQSATARTA